MNAIDRMMLDRAALAALRGLGRVEPNPMVGCIIGDESGQVLGMGHHQDCGGPHAEIQALANCQRRGAAPRGAVCWVTLEPCCTHGRTPPCTDALVKAGISRVVYAQRDSTLPAPGGAGALESAGVGVTLSDASPFASSLALPFLKRADTGLPWVIAKWAQTIDGKIATSSGQSKWISSPTARRSVHRLRGMVDAILTAIGTVRADDPELTARGMHRRRIARRIVIDPRLETPLNSRLVATVGTVPLTLVAAQPHPRRRELEQRGAHVMVCPDGRGGVDTRAALKQLASDQGVSTVLVESGPGLLGRLLRADLIDQIVVHIAPMVMADPDAPAALSAGHIEALDDVSRFTLWRLRRRAGDIEAHYIRAHNH